MFISWQSLGNGRYRVFGEGFYADVVLAYSTERSYWYVDHIIDTNAPAALHADIREQAPTFVCG